jgi:hypothetical protein
MAIGPTRPVFGVGINDADYITNKTNWVNGRSVKEWQCPIHQTWSSILRRCYSPYLHKRIPTYIGCEIHPDWVSFMGFREWMLSQDWQGKHLDKDLITRGNKIYSPETCVFVDQALNNFTTTRAGRRGRYLIGACKIGSTFLAQCRNPFTHRGESLGNFPTEMEAHLAWQAKKHEHAVKLVESITDLRVKRALLTRYAPKEDWTTV